MAQQRVQPYAVFGRLDLASVGGAHGGQGVGQQDPGLEQVHVVVELHDAAREQRVVEAHLAHDLAAEDALVAEVVNREHRLQAEERRVVGEPVPQVGDGQAALPVMDVDDVRTVHVPDDVERGLAEHAEPHMVVRVVGAIGRVKAAGAIVEVGTVDQEERDPAFDHNVDLGRVGIRAEPDREALGNPLGRAERDRAIPRQHHRHVVAVAHERRRQRPDHIREAATLGKGHGF